MPQSLHGPSWRFPTFGPRCIFLWLRLGSFRSSTARSTLGYRRANRLLHFRAGSSQRREPRMSDITQEIAVHIPGLRRYARALARDVVAADDLVQECLTRALGKLHLWRGGDLRAWLFTILHNQHVNEVRRSVRRGTTVELSDPKLRLNRPPNQDKVLELRDLDRALGQLPAEQRAVILLIGLEGMPYAAVGEVLGIPIGTVRSRLFRGRHALRRLMDAEADHPDLPTTPFWRPAATPRALGIPAV
jgi:RNA polymerase sigma-70 factor (ECF subfamily)